jgi:fumarate reductase subunit D
MGFMHSQTNNHHSSYTALQLVGICLASMLIYVLAFLFPANLFILYNQPRLDISLLYRGGTIAFLRMIFAFVSLGLLYWGGYRLTSRHTQGKAAWFIVVCGMLAFVAIFLCMAPFDAADIYDNIMHGRILGVYSGDPFRQVIANYPQDPFFQYTAWKDSSSAYGPLWEFLAGLTSRLSGDGIIANVMAFKFLPGLFHLASVGIVYLILQAKAPEKALSGVLLLGWNPVVLFETWGNGHNDMAMAFWLLLAFFWMSRQHYTSAVFSLLLGALIKFIPVLLIPVVIVIGWRDLRKMTSRLIFLTKTVVGSGLLTALLYYPFWAGFSTLDIGRRMQLFTTSIPSVVNKALTPLLGAQASDQIISLSALGLLLLFVLYQSLFTGKHDLAHDYLQATFNILAFYLMTVCLWFHQWYGLWLITLSPLLSKGNRRLALLFGFWVLSQNLWFGPLIVPKIIKAPPGQAVWLEALLTLGVMGVPWLYALWNLWQERRVRRIYHAA